MFPLLKQKAKTPLAFEHPFAFHFANAKGANEGLAKQTPFN
jgi:hypothetical protein